MQEFHRNAKSNTNMLAGFGQLVPRMDNFFNKQDTESSPDSRLRQSVNALIAAKRSRMGLGVKS
jgi:hypothetical protein